MSEDRGVYRKAMVGNRNALKYETPTDVRVTFRCHSSDRELWRETASRQGQTFSEWAIHTLNKAVATAGCYSSQAKRGDLNA